MRRFLASLALAVAVMLGNTVVNWPGDRAGWHCALSSGQVECYVLVSVYVPDPAPAVQLSPIPAGHGG